MGREHFLVVGARGFIGAWICRLLVDEGVQVTATDASPDPRSVDTVLTEQYVKSIKFHVSDSRDADETERLIGDEITHVIYLAGLLRPASEKNPLLSSQVSIGGLINVLNASTKRNGRLSVVYSSTAAVYGSVEEYPGRKIVADSRPNPKDHYGVTRYAMELTADVYARQNGVNSVGLRPWIVYGAGRFNGLTAQPSLAMLAAAARAPYHMQFGGRVVISHAREVANAFIRAARANPKGSVHANIAGELIEMEELIEIIYRCAPEARGMITCAPSTGAKREALDDPTLERLIGPLPPQTENRVRETIEDYRRLLKEQRVSFP